MNRSPSEAPRAAVGNSPTPRTRLLAVLDGVSLTCGLVALAALVILIGWPLDALGQVRLRSLCTLALMAFVVQEALRLLLQADKRAYLRTRYLEVALAALVAFEVAAGTSIVAWLGKYAPGLPGSNLTLLYLAASQLTLIAVVGLRMLRENQLFAARRLSPGMVFLLSFALLIGIGTLLLKTPKAGTQVPLSWIDALFTATSAACVTGLTSVDVPTTFSRHGQWIILGLIQIGGLGVMTLTYFFAYFLAGGVSLRSRIALRDLLSEENLDHIGTVLGVVVGFTLLIELAGAFLIHLSLRGSGLPPGELVFFSLFHAISAFCNAGFSTLSAGLADARVVDRTGFLSIVMILIVVGGLGFPVLKNFWLVSYAHLTRWIRPARTQKPRLSTNSRIVLTTNAVLILGGALTIGLTEFYFGYGQRAGSAVFTSVFHSITARTAGFNVTATENLLPATAAVLMALMFVGGSPSSTAGGIKTTTLAVAFLSLRRIVTGRADIEAFGRRLEPQIADRALAIVLLSIAFILLVTVLLCTLHPELPPANLAFEAVSAVSTVGLTRGVTLQLGPAAKVVLVVAMLVGRVGVLLCVFSFLPRRRAPGYRLPQTTVVLG